METLIQSLETPELQNLAMTRLSMPINSIIKNPAVEKWRTFVTSNALIKPLIQNNKEVVETLLDQVGFKKLSDSSFKY